MRQKKLGKCPTEHCHSTNFYFLVRVSNLKGCAHYRCRVCGNVFSANQMLPYFNRVRDAKIPKAKNHKSSKEVINL